jgi:hypothetical protein
VNSNFARNLLDPEPRSGEFCGVKGYRFLKAVAFDAAAPFSGILSTLLRCATFSKKAEFSLIVTFPQTYLIRPTFLCIRTPVALPPDASIKLYVFALAQWQSVVLSRPTHVWGTVYAFEVGSPLPVSVFGIVSPISIVEVELFGSVFTSRFTEAKRNDILSRIASERNALERTWSTLRLPMLSQDELSQASRELGKFETLLQEAIHAEVRQFTYFSDATKEELNRLKALNATRRDSIRQDEVRRSEMHREAEGADSRSQIESFDEELILLALRHLELEQRRLYL